MKFIKLLSLAALTLFFCSCGDVKEEIYINEDGTGKYIFQTDMIPGLTQMSMSMYQMFAAMDTTKAPLNEDSLRTAIQAKIWEDFPDEIDSLIDLTNEMPKEVSEDAKKREMLDRMEAFMRGNKKDGYVNIGMSYNFKSTEDLKEVFKLLRASSATQNKLPNSPISKLSDVDFITDFEIDGNKVSRKVELVSEPATESEMEELKELFPDATYQTIVYLPREVKSAKGESIVKAEGKMVVLEYNMLESMMGRVSTDFEIIMKD